MRFCVVGVIAKHLLCFQRHVNKAVYKLVEVAFLHKAQLDGCQDLAVADAVGGGHFELLPRKQARYTFIFRAPVGHDDALIAPFVAQHIGQQPLVFRAVSPV